MKNYETINLQMNEKVAWLTLKREPVNVLNIEMMQEIVDALETLISHEQPHALVIRAEGKAFSAGVAIEDHIGDKAEPMIHVFHKMFHLLTKIPCPTVAVVEGAAIGGGCEIASFCDISIATERAKFGQPEINLGLFPPVSVAVFPLLMGLNRTMELLLTGKTISAVQAKEYGLINDVVNEEELETYLEDLLDSFRSKSRTALNITRMAIRESLATTFAQTIGKVEQIYLNDLMKTQDAQEGLDSFLDKRKPVWSHS
ncbi:enoyl-CoA hydratase/isomerase family protein [Halalkalibacter krulwichiae]|uniref:Putative enoyl-CoA hydratase echA8 n=1 Tax=Halalkalibacter krulwichiae TaxID=199441 RepID=A0A1X9MBE9_9BACI|nr:enoyl-CoA hydratase/isomerase family protein [Halalkalibacter krulwichiae]ARK28901.1 putative enoyl-CoA hydratase echA8 [Halalkalibacter krulwichiae]